MSQLIGTAPSTHLAANDDTAARTQGSDLPWLAALSCRLPSESNARVAALLAALAGRLSLPFSRVIRDSDSNGVTVAVTGGAPGSAAIAWPLHWGARQVGVLTLGGRTASDTALSAEERAVIQVIGTHLAAELHALELEEAIATANARLQEAGRTDPITSLLNRAGLEEAFRTRAGRGRGDGLRAAVLVHVPVEPSDASPAAWERVLAATGACLVDTVRGDDRVGRISHNEFLVLLRRASLADAIIIDKRVREALARAAATEVVPATTRFATSVTMIRPGTRMSQVIQTARGTVTRRHDDPHASAVIATA